MSKFRNRPIEVEAWQYTGTNADELHEIFGRMKRDLLFGEIGIFSPEESGYRVVACGDWIIRTAEQKLRTCKPDIFAATYERVP